MRTVSQVLELPLPPGAEKAFRRTHEEEFLAKLFATLVDDPEIKRKIGLILNKSGLGAKLLAMVKMRR